MVKALKGGSEECCRDVSAKSREKLEAWLAANTTGDTLARAGVPAEWRVGDKTGRRANGSTNDIAIVRPPVRAPIILCVYLTESGRSVEERGKVVAEVARVAAGGDRDSLKR
jgi:beta-lactamase class A